MGAVVVLITPARMVAVIAKALAIYQVLCEVLFHELAHLLITIIL